jgi:acid phosphatase type 7
MRSLLILGLALATAGCSDSESSTPPPPSGPLTSYQPDGCAHTVTLPPEVTEAGRDDGVIGQAAPNHLHLGFVGPTESSIAANWHTDLTTGASQLLVGTDRAAVEAAEGAGAGVTLVSGHHFNYGSLLDAEPARVHEAHVCGLSPSTTYFYKVGGPGAWSAVHDFATAPPVGDKEVFRFAVAGDSRNDPGVFAQVEEGIAAQGVDFQLFSGDAVATGASQLNWDAFFEASTGNFTFEDAAASAPFMPVNGNHESLAINYVAQFALPQEITPGEIAAGKEWYSFDYANVHVVALNDSPESSALGAAQLGWLEADLAAVDRDKTPWIFAIHHRSTYSCGGSHGSDLDLRAAWQPIFDSHAVDIVFSGHDHLYERTKPIRAGAVAAAGLDDEPVDESGTIYVVSGGAGAPLYDADGSCVETHFTEAVRNYVVVEIEDRTMRYTAYDLNGAVLDEFTYAK